MIKAIIYFIVDKLFELIVKMLFNHHKSFNKISLSKWWEVKDGNLQYLYKWIRFKKYPSFFVKVFQDMIFQMDRVDTTLLRMMAKEARLRSLHQTTDKVDYLNKANFELAKINKLKDKKKKEVKLNEFIDYIELTFNDIGKIDPDKMNAGRAYSLYYKALERNGNN